MTTIDRISIAAEPDAVYELAARVESWPRFLPHYRYVNVLKDEGRHRVVEMAARRGRWPVRWVSKQDLDPVARRVEYRHIEGVTRGMWVEWRIEPSEEGTEIKLLHELAYPVPLLGEAFARYIVGGMFVHHIASRTLAGIKKTAEER